MAAVAARAWNRRALFSYVRLIIWSSGYPHACAHTCGGWYFVLLICHADFHYGSNAHMQLPIACKESINFSNIYSTCSRKKKLFNYDSINFVGAFDSSKSMDWKTFHPCEATTDKYKIQTSIFVRWKLFILKVHI